MKKIIFLIAMALVAIITIRCKEDAEIPALKFDIDVTTDATISERGINDESVIKFDLKTDYDYAAAPLLYKVSYENIGILKLNGEELNKDTTYKLNKPELTLSYFGKEAGKHTIKVHFFNDKGINVLKEIEIPYVKYNFTVSTVGDEAPYQGELKEYKLTITPENATVKDSYKIKFISYDENDPSLQKSYVALNGTKIEFNKVYDIDVTKEQKITLKSFHSGAKNLIYTIINNSSEKQEKIGQNIKASEIEVKNLSFNKLTTNTLGDNLQLRGFINKTPALSKGIQYRTWIVEVPNEQKDGVENTDNTYKDFTLPDNNEFVLNVKVKKYGTYKYMLQFKDEFGTESAPTSFEIKAIDKNFEVEQKVTTNLENVIQGQRVELLFHVKEMEATNEEYQVQFLSFDEKDVNLQKTKISFNNAQIQLNKWYTVKKGEQNLIAITTSYAGSKKLVYQVKNSIYNKTSALEFNVKKATISLSNLSLKTSKSRVLIGETFKVEGTVEKTYPGNKTIEYKTWLSSGNASNFRELTNTYRGYELPQDNMLSLDFKVTGAGNYTLKVQAKDEFGNESEPKEFAIIVKNNEFEIEQKVNTDINRVIQGEEVDIDFKIKEEFETNETFQVQFISFDSADLYLNKSEIKLNNEKIQLNKWYSVSKTAFNKIKIKSFKAGDKKLVYQVKNSAYTKNKEVNINILKEQFTVSLYSPYKKIVPTKPFDFKIKITANNHNKEVSYYLKFDYLKIKYNGRSYSEGESIPIEFENGQIEKEIDIEGLVPNNVNLDYNFNAIPYGKVYNSDNTIYEIKAPEVIKIIELNGISVLGKRCRESLFSSGDGYFSEGYYIYMNRQYMFGDEEIFKNRSNIKFKIYLFYNNVSRIFDENTYDFSYDDLISNNNKNNIRIEDAKTILDNRRKHYFSPAFKYGDKMIVEIYYNNKIIYRTNINISLVDTSKEIFPFNEWEKIKDLMYMSLSKKGTIYYENYDHIMK